VVALLAWIACMGVLVHRAHLEASPRQLATDLARYGPTASWRGVYYRGEKIGFTVSQTVRTHDGFELQEDGHLQMTLLGAVTAAHIRTTAAVDSMFALRSFEFSLDPGTGPIHVRGTIEPDGPDGQHRASVTIVSAGESRTEHLTLPEAPALSLNLSRLLASGGLVPGTRHRMTIFDPATLTNASVEVLVGRRELVQAGETHIPAFRVDMTFQGLQTTSWVTDTGEVVREDSPLGLMTVRESAAHAQGMAVSSRVQSDLLQAAAVVPLDLRQRIDDPRAVRHLRVRLDGLDLTNPDLVGAGQTIVGTTLDLRDSQSLGPGPRDPEARQYLDPEPLIESDAPEIRAASATALQGVVGPRARAERLTRYVNALLDKKPTLSLPSARDVLRTKVGDCNEHTALYVAMARAAGIPARIAVGLVYVRGVTGAFYYHAWPEVYLEEPDGRGLWLPADPTLNEFPADATHVRLARGGLSKQAAILPLVGRLKMTVLDLELAPGATPILIGAEPPARSTIHLASNHSAGGACRCSR
jgi:hypothetical protein